MQVFLDLMHKLCYFKTFKPNFILQISNIAKKIGKIAIDNIE